MDGWMDHGWGGDTRRESGREGRKGERVRRRLSQASEHHL